MNMKISAVVITSALVGMQVQAMEKALLGLGAAAVISVGAFASSNGSSEAPSERKEQKQEQPARPTTPESIAQAELKTFNAQVAEESRALNERAEKQRAKLRGKIEEARRKKADREAAARASQEAARVAQQRKTLIAAFTQADSNLVTAFNTNFVADGQLSLQVLTEALARISALEQKIAAKDARAAAKAADAARKRAAAAPAVVPAVPTIPNFVQAEAARLDAHESKVTAAGVDAVQE